MILNCSIAHQNIVEEDDDELSEKGFKEQIHGGQEGRWCVTQPDWHYLKLVMAMVCSKRRLQYIIDIHAYLVIALEKVKLRKALSTT